MADKVKYLVLVVRRLAQGIRFEIFRLLLMLQGGFWRLLRAPIYVNQVAYVGRSFRCQILNRGRIFCPPNVNQCSLRVSVSNLFIGQGFAHCTTVKLSRLFRLRGLFSWARFFHFSYRLYAKIVIRSDAGMIRNTYRLGRCTPRGNILRYCPGAAWTRG